MGENGMRTVMARINALTMTACIRLSMVLSTQFNLRGKKGSWYALFAIKTPCTFPVRHAGMWLSRTAMCKCFIMEITHALSDVQRIWAQRRTLRNIFGRIRPRSPLRCNQHTSSWWWEPRGLAQNQQTSERVLRTLLLWQTQSGFQTESRRWEKRLSHMGITLRPSRILNNIAM